jgi:acetyl-CoA carboxylase biotin carboxylase subunit
MYLYQSQWWDNGNKFGELHETREEAIDTMHRALSEYVIEGVKTTIPFHLQLMQNEDFRKGNFTTKFLESFKMK